MSRRNKSRPAGGIEKPITATLDAFSNQLFSLGYGSQSPLEATEYPLTRMTDNYALEIYETLFIPRGWALSGVDHR